MSRTYKAVQVTKPGTLKLVERAIVEPAPGQVRIRVEACGVCHSDALTVEGGFPGLTFCRTFSQGSSCSRLRQATTRQAQPWANFLYAFSVFEFVKSASRFLEESAGDSLAAVRNAVPANAAVRAAGLVHFRNEAGFHQSARRGKGDGVSRLVFGAVVPPFFRSRELRLHVTLCERNERKRACRCRWPRAAGDA
jgi:hypothetical protein